MVHTTSMTSTARKRTGGLRRTEALAGFLFISPWLIGFLAFGLVPMLASLALSLSHYDLVNPPRWAALENYVRAFTADEQFWPSLQRTFYYVLLDVPAGIVLSLLLAAALNQRLRAAGLYRTLFFLPSITPAVAAIMFWLWLLNPEFGIVNYLLGLVGIWGPGWLGSPDWAVPGLVIMDLWATIGGTRMIVFLAGLQSIPQEMYEAAEVDGAPAWRRFVHITLPLLTPTIFFNVVLTVIYAMRVFTSAYIATQGGPAYATWFFSLHIYRQAFYFYQMGYASALGWIFLVVLLFFTYLQFRFQSRWVFYQGEVR